MNLPLIDSQRPDDEERWEFGHKRTRCDCSECLAPCRYIPGFLIPSDLYRLANSTDSVTVDIFATAHLLASPGAIVMKDGKKYRIPTLVPARKKDQSCKFLT